MRYIVDLMNPVVTVSVQTTITRGRLSTQLPARTGRYGLGLRIWKRRGDNCGYIRLSKPSDLPPVTAWNPRLLGGFGGALGGT